MPMPGRLSSVTVGVAVTVAVAVTEAEAAAVLEVRVGGPTGADVMSAC